MKKIISMFMAVALVMATMTVPASAIKTVWHGNGTAHYELERSDFESQEAYDDFMSKGLGIEDYNKWWREYKNISTPSTQTSATPQPEPTATPVPVATPTPTPKAAPAPVKASAPTATPQPTAKADNETAPTNKNGDKFLGVMEDGREVYVSPDGGFYFSYPANDKAQQAYERDLAAIEAAEAAKAAQTPAPAETPKPVPAAVETPKPVAETMPAANGKFTDVPADAWYAEAVNALADGGLVNGIGDGKFNPQGTVTYGEFVTILNRLFGMPSTMNKKHAMSSWSSYGWRAAMPGPDGEMPHWAFAACVHMDTRAFGGQMVVQPEDLDCNVLRAHAIAIIEMAYERSGQSMTPVNAYTEADIPDWNLVEGIDIGGQNHGNPLTNYVIGDRLNFLPDQYVCTSMTDPTPTGYYQPDIDDRARIVAEHVPEAAYKPTVVARPDKVLLAYNLGLAKGIDENRTCGALNTLTRAELCQLLYNAGLTREAMCTPDKAE